MPPELERKTLLEALIASGPEENFVLLDGWRTLTAAGELSEEAFHTSEAALAALEEADREGAEVLPSRWAGTLILENVRTDDDREMAEGSLEWRPLPIPLMFLPDTTMGHQEASICGSIDGVSRMGNRILGEGPFDLGGEAGREAARLLAAGILRWVSADLAVREYDIYEEGNCALPDEDEIDSVGDLFQDDCHIIFRVVKGTIMGATMVPFPAFQDAVIEAVQADGSAILAHTESGVANELLAAGRTRESEDGARFFCRPQPLSGEDPEHSIDPARVASGIANPAILDDPPAEWFLDPRFGTSSEDDARLVFQPHTGGYACPLTVTPEGRVFGHITTWDSCHIGREDVCLPPPRSQTGYAFFATGEAPCDCEDGLPIPVGQLTIGGGHADIRLGHKAAVEHYDNVATAWADVSIGEDAIGPWIAGAVRPGTTPEQLRIAKASGPSGDWRRIGGNLELVAVHQVNVQGYPIARRQLAAHVAGGAPQALVASGPVSELRSSDRLEKLERAVASLQRIADPLRALAAAELRAAILP